MNTKYIITIPFLVFSTFVNAYDGIDKRIAKEIYTQEIQDGFSDSCIYRNDNYVSGNTRKFLVELRSQSYGNYKKQNFDGVNITAVIDDFKKLYSRIDHNYCFNPSKNSYTGGFGEYRIKDEQNKTYVYFYLLYESLNVYKRVSGENIDIPEFETNFPCKKYEEFQNYTFSNRSSHYYKAHKVNEQPLVNRCNFGTQTEKNIPLFVDLYENCIVDDIPMDILLVESSQAEELGLLVDNKMRGFCKGNMDDYFENAKNTGRWLIARHDTKYRVKEIVPVKNSSIKLIHVVAVGTEETISAFSTKSHYGYIPSNVWDGLRQNKIEEELKSIKQKEHLNEAITVQRNLKIDLDNLLDEEKKLKSELKLVKKELKSEKKFLKDSDNISAILKKTTKNNINTLSKKQKELEEKLSKLNVKIIDLKEKMSEMKEHIENGLNESSK